MTTLRFLYWDCTCFGRSYPDGIGRFTVALAERTYGLPSRFLLPPYLAEGALHHAIAKLPGEVVVAHRHPRRRYPWRWYWEQVLYEPGIVIAPGNFHRPCRTWPTLTIVHDLIPYTEKDYAKHAHASRRAYQHMLETSSRLIAISEWTRTELARFAPAAPPATVLRQGLFPPVPPQPIPSLAGRVFYLFVGGAEPRKRLERAVAWCQELGDAPLVAVGRDWSHDRTMQGLLAPLGTSAVHLSGIDDGALSWLYQHCRAVLLPTRSEGFGLVGLEALRAGRPVVASPMTSLPEILGQHALWVPQDGPCDGPALRARIDAWRPTDELQRHLASFDWDAARDHFAARIQEMLSAC